MVSYTVLTVLRIYDEDLDQRENFIKCIRDTVSQALQASQSFAVPTS